MMTSRAWVTFRQHRFETGFATLASLGAAAWGSSIALQISALNVSEDCLNGARSTTDVTALGDECFSIIQAATAILGETFIGGGGTLQLSVMGALPFIVGLLGGLPIVSRELEERTAQTAWWLNASRTSWLLRQIVPIGLLIAVVVGVAAIVATPVADAWVRWGLGGGAELIGLHGPLALLRAFAAFGVGLATGALLGRTLPGFIFSVAILLAVLMLAGQAREAWISRLPLTVVATQNATGQWIVVPGAEVRSFGFGTPDGNFLTREEARQLATEAGVPPPDPDDEQDTPAAIWLEENGYAEIPLGVTDEAALGWAPYDGLAFAIVGSLSVAGGFVVVNRRRAT